MSALRAVRTLDSLAALATADGRWLVCRSADRTFRIWDVQSATLVSEFEDRGVWGQTLARTAAGKWLAAASVRKTMTIWDLESGQPMRTLAGENRAQSAAFGGDGRWLAAVSDDWGDDPLLVWEVDTGAVVLERNVSDHTTGAPLLVTMSADGHRVVAGFHFGFLSAWDVRTRRLLRTWKNHPGTLSAVATTSDGRWIASGSINGTVTVWDLENNLEARTITGHDSPVSAVAVSDGCRRVLSSSADKTLRLWDGESRRELARLNVDAAITYCAFTPDGRGGVAIDALGRASWLGVQG